MIDSSQEKSMHTENTKKSPFLPHFPRNSTPQVKICGLTRVDEALACVELGAAAIGCVFYPRSPRNVTEDQARSICLALPRSVCSVGVFVNEDLGAILGKVERCGLQAVQLHGRESVEMVRELRRANIPVIKALFVNGEPSLIDAGKYDATAYLVECTGGPLPGGNAMAWDWSVAAPLHARYPVIVAGGLNPENVAQAMGMASLDALDVSSGVEKAPGRKDPDKVRRFMVAVSQASKESSYRRVFQHLGETDETSECNQDITPAGNE